MDNTDVTDETGSAKVDHSNIVTRRGYSPEASMAMVKQHRPINRESDLILKVSDGRGLRPRAEKRTSRNPYFVVWLEDRLIGRSPVAISTLRPSWNDASNHFVLPYDNTLLKGAKYRTRTSSNVRFGAKYEHVNLQIEVWDQLNTGQKEFLGCVVVKGDMYDAFDPLQMSRSDVSEQWFPLQKSEVIPPYLQSAVGGEIKLSLSPPDTVKGPSGKEFEDAEPVEDGIPFAFELTICSAENLSRADTFGLSDPFCIVKFDGVEIGRTTVLHKTTNPVWSGERFIISITIPFFRDITNPLDCTLPADSYLQATCFI